MSELLDWLEILAAKFPWDEVEITTRRKPNGSVSYQAYLPSNELLGAANYVFGYGDDMDTACHNLIKQAGDRDPEAATKDRIAKLQMEIHKLKQLNFALPPYRAPGQVGYRQSEPEPVPEAAPPPFVNVESTVKKNGEEDVPF